MIDLVEINYLNINNITNPSLVRSYFQEPELKSGVLYHPCVLTSYRENIVNMKILLLLFYHIFCIMGYLYKNKMITV